MTITVMLRSSPFLLTTFLIALPLPVRGCLVWLHLPEAWYLGELWAPVTPIAPTVAVVKPFLHTTHTEGVPGSSNNNNNNSYSKHEELQTCRNAQCPASPHLMWGSLANFTLGLQSIGSRCPHLTHATPQHTRLLECQGAVEAVSKEESKM